MNWATEHWADWRRTRVQAHAAEPRAHHVDSSLAVFGAGAIGWLLLTLLTLQGLTQLGVLFHH